MDIRQVYLRNFEELFRKTKNIPISMLIDPLLNSYSAVPYDLCPGDFSFFLEISDHPKVTPQIACSMINVLSKIFIDHLVFSACC